MAKRKRRAVSDKERMDFLRDRWGGLWGELWIFWRPRTEASLRKAIDAAIKAQEKGGGKR